MQRFSIPFSLQSQLCNRKTPFRNFEKHRNGVVIEPHCIFNQQILLHLHVTIGLHNVLKLIISNTSILNMLSYHLPALRQSQCSTCPLFPTAYCQQTPNDLVQNCISLFNEATNNMDARCLQPLVWVNCLVSCSV